MQINSCRFCKKIFRYPIKRTVCEDCVRLDNELFERIRVYLDQYPNSNAMQVAAGLELDVREILRYIDEGRLFLVKGEFSRLEDEKNMPGMEVKTNRQDGRR